MSTYAVFRFAFPGEAVSPHRFIVRINFRLRWIRLFFWCVFVCVCFRAFDFGFSQQGHFLELKNYLENEGFATRKHEQLTTTGYLIASRKGINVNWKVRAFSVWF